MDDPIPVEVHQPPHHHPGWRTGDFGRDMGEHLGAGHAAVHADLVREHRHRGSAAVAAALDRSLGVAPRKQRVDHRVGHRRVGVEQFVFQLADHQVDQPGGVEPDTGARRGRGILVQRHSRKCALDHEFDKLVIIRHVHGWVGVLFKEGPRAREGGTDEEWQTAGRPEEYDRD